jgi:hypothetical protein
MSTTIPPTTDGAVTNTDASLLTDYEVESTYRDVNDVQLHVVTAGNPDAPLVVLLHGHPDFWYGWRDQIRSLVEADFRVSYPPLKGWASALLRCETTLFFLDEGTDPLR